MRHFGRVGLAGLVLGSGVLGALFWKRATPPPTIKAKPAARAPVESQASIAGDAAEARLLDRVEPVGLGADAARLPPIGAASSTASAPESVASGIGQFVSWASSAPGPAAELPPELTRPYPEAIQPGSALQSVSHGQTAGKAAPSSTTTTLFHEVRDGDTLAQLAQRYLGSSERYAEIFEANRDLLSHPDVLPLGAKLKILVARDGANAVGAPQTDRLVPLGP